MNEIILQQAAYTGSKEINLHNIPVARATGFSAAADDYMERGIDLNEQLVKNKPATFFLRMIGDAMIGTGIKNGDILIVDRSLAAISGKIIIAALDGELLVRLLRKEGCDIVLLAGNCNYPPVTINEFRPYSVWGVVTCVIHLV